MNHATAIIDNRPFLRECMRRSIEFVLTTQVIPFSTISEMETVANEVDFSLVIFSSPGLVKEEIAKSFEILERVFPSVPAVFLSDSSDPDLVGAAIGSGAKGCIPVTMEFEIALAAARIVMAGGTYVPAEYIGRLCGTDFET